MTLIQIRKYMVPPFLRCSLRNDIVTTDDGYGDSGGKSYDKTKAIERAARKNITLALERMSTVNIVPASK